MYDMFYAISGKKKIIREIEKQCQCPILEPDQPGQESGSEILMVGLKWQTLWNANNKIMTALHKFFVMKSKTEIDPCRAIKLWLLHIKILCK